jgi:biotin carboxyl carrier protein
MTMSNFVKLKLMSGSYTTTLNKMFTLRKPWHAENPGLVRAFMPGTVEEVRVKVGDKVAEGDVLIIFRAMKMNNRMLAPVAGTVKKVGAIKGENVPKGTELVEIA